METCYVCSEDMDIEKLENREEGWSYVCHKISKDGTVRYRHLWHGLAGHRPYYKSREMAKIIEGKILDSPYSAPEARSGAKVILDAVEADPKPEFDTIKESILPETKIEPYYY